MEPRKQTIRARAVRSRKSLSPPDLQMVLGVFSEAISLVRIVRASLSGREVAADEEAVLHRALSLLDRAYNDLDLASGRPS